MRPEDAQWKERFDSECAIVDRCWKALGISTYEQAGSGMKAIDDHIEAAVKDAARYRYLQRTSCGNTAGGKGSDEECLLSLNPRDMDASIDAAMQERLPQAQNIKGDSDVG